LAIRPNLQKVLEGRIKRVDCWHITTSRFG
jgi:hypothetical protein